MTAEEFKNKVIPFSRKLYPMLMRILKDEEETKDALQELLVKLWNKKHKLDDCENMNAYIITMARNQGFDLLKKKRPSRIGEKDEHKILNLEAESINEEAKERYEQVKKIIKKLPENYRTVIELRDIDGFEFEEIREITGFEIPNIRVILSRARQKVKTEVEKIYDYEDAEQLTQQIL